MSGAESMGDYEPTDIDKVLTNIAMGEKKIYDSMYAKPTAEYQALVQGSSLTSALTSANVGTRAMFQTAPRMVSRGLESFGVTQTRDQKAKTQRTLDLMEASTMVANQNKMRKSMVGLQNSGLAGVSSVSSSWASPQVARNT